MFESLRHHAKSQSLRSGSGLFRRLPVSQHSWQFKNLCYPSAIVFLLNLNGEIHKPPRSNSLVVFYTYPITRNSPWHLLKSVSN